MFLNISESISWIANKQMQTEYKMYLFHTWFRVLAFLSCQWNLHYYQLSINYKLDQTNRVNV